MFRKLEISPFIKFWADVRDGAGFFYGGGGYFDCVLKQLMQFCMFFDVFVDVGCVFVCILSVIQKFEFALVRY